MIFASYDGDSGVENKKVFASVPAVNVFNQTALSPELARSSNK